MPLNLSSMRQAKDKTDWRDRPALADTTTPTSNLDLALAANGTDQTPNACRKIEAGLSIGQALPGAYPEAIG